MVTIGVGLGISAAAVAGLAADVEASTGDIMWLEEPRASSGGEVCWSVVERDPWLELQEYAMGSIGKVVRFLKSPVTGEQVKDFRLLLRLTSPDSVSHMEIAVSPNKLSLQKAQFFLRRVARAAELKDCVDAFDAPGVPDAIVKLVQDVSRRRAARGHNGVSAEHQCLLRADIQLQIFSFLSGDIRPVHQMNMEIDARQQIVSRLSEVSPPSALGVVATTPNSFAAFAQGDRVHGLYNSIHGPCWYGATIAQVQHLQGTNSHCQYMIDWDDGDQDQRLMQAHQLRFRAMPRSVRDLARCAQVCSHWLVVSCDDLLWSKSLLYLNHEFGLVDEQALDAVVQSGLASSEITFRDIFILTRIEQARISASRHGEIEAFPVILRPVESVARGLYGLGDELGRGLSEGSAALAVGAYTGGYTLGTIGGAVGAATLAAPAAVAGCALGAAGSCGNAGHSAVGGAQAGAALGFYAGGTLGCATGGVVGSGAGAACGALPCAFRVTEAAGQGTAAFAGHVAVALRGTPDAALGPVADNADLSDITHNSGFSGSIGVSHHGRGITWGLLLGLHSLGQDCAAATTGLVFEPLRGAQDCQRAGAPPQRVAIGALKGLGRALIGLVARPAAGTLDVASGVLRGAGNRMQQCRQCTLVSETRDELSEARSIMGCGTSRR